MKPTKYFLLVAAALLLGGCASYERDQGGANDPYFTDTVGSAQPAASPTFRPGMNPQDPRDPHFTTRPQPEVSPSTTKP